MKALNDVYQGVPQGTVYQGIPQGTDLGQLRFNLYVNSMQNHIPGNSNLVQYADDTFVLLLQIVILLELPILREF